MSDAEKLKKLKDGLASRMPRPVKEKADRRAINDWLDDLFTYHKPTEEQIWAMQQIRDQAKHLAEDMDWLGCSSPELTLAIRALHLATMHFNSSVVLHGLCPEKI